MYESATDGHLVSSYCNRQTNIGETPALRLIHRVHFSAAELGHRVALLLPQGGLSQLKCGHEQVRGGTHKEVRSRHKKYCTNNQACKLERNRWTISLLPDCCRRLTGVSNIARNEGHPHSSAPPSTQRTKRLLPSTAYHGLLKPRSWMHYKGHACHSSPLGGRVRSGGPASHP